MKCQKCGAENSDGSSNCVQCGAPLSNDVTPEDSLQTTTQDLEPNQAETNQAAVVNEKKASSKSLPILKALCAVFLIIGFVFFVKGFNVKNNYNNSELSYENAYVGGDAYNYIINGTYFTGYVVIASASVLCSVVCLGTAFIIAGKNE